MGANHGCRLEAAVLDLVADDSEGLQKQKSVYHWDKVLQVFDCFLFYLLSLSYIFIVFA